MKAAAWHTGDGMTGCRRARRMSRELTLQPSAIGVRKSAAPRWSWHRGWGMRVDERRLLMIAGRMNAKDQEAPTPCRNQALSTEHLHPTLR